ncbi:fimbrial protein [Stenotrophomonas sp. ZAC14D2_NAIMI4_7]|uniref:fimbrial protein n=1 Tax=Stenotrophomonas sp. ZAC14D2_NAIMI4_7 TaxID=2072405 RepID=UPI00131F39EE|nr:fimbrial protein [Stenotrophomonas sp. ZAC14D2_NAIMI4_7]
MSYAQTVPVRFVEAPDVLLHTAASEGISFVCDHREDASLRPLIAGLNYVRHIDGAPAYEISQDSPLVVVWFASEFDDGSEALEGPLDAFGQNSWHFPLGKSQTWAKLFFYSRGGPMRPQLQRSLGSVQVDGSGGAEFRFDIGYEFHGTTCALSNANVVLDPIPAQDLDAASTAGDKDFVVTMSCGVPGRPVSLQIHDATDRGNASDVLAPAAGSGTQGVGLQIMHKGFALPMGRVWAHTESTGAAEDIAFTARYLRLPGKPLVPGAIIGEAILLADYY